jgi:uncharacterized RDD family membrane protein YckC
MTDSMLILVYLIYAIVQAILAARYLFGLEEKDSPVFATIIMAVFAPFVSIGTLMYGAYVGINWLVTYRGKKDE